jgi:hypothetical protein
MTSQLSSLLFLVVGLSMALTPWLAAGGQLIAARFEQQDVRSLLPQENEVQRTKYFHQLCSWKVPDTANIVTLAPMSSRLLLT